MPSSWAVEMTSIQVAAGSLPLVRTQRTSSSRISAAVPGTESRPRLLRGRQPLADGHAGPGRAVHHLHRGEGVDVHTGDAGLHRLRDVEVRRPGQVGVDAALHADLDRAEVPGLLGPVGDLVEGERVRVGVRAALREGAETAPGVADVREVDVPGDDVRDVVADRRLADVVRDPAERVQRRPVRVQQGQRLVVRQLRGVVGRRRQRLPYVRVDALGGHTGRRRLTQGAPVAVDGVEVLPAVAGTALGVDGGVQIRTAGGDEDLLGLLPRVPLDDRVRQGEARPGVGEGPDVRQEARVEPRLAPRHELRVHTQAFAQLEPGGAGPLGEFLDLRPGPLGVHMVDGERRHAAPVVDPGGDQPLVLAVDEVRRGLDAARRAHDVPGDGHRGDQLVQLRVRHAAHRGVRLGAEVLDDQFLDAVVRPGHLPQREERLRALLVRLPDPDEDSGREGDGGTARVLQDPQPDRRFLVRGAVVRAARLGPQSCRGGLQHHPHRRGDGLEPLEVRPAQHAGVEVREQSRLLQDADRDGPDVRDRVVVPVRVEPLARLRPAVLRLVAERDQGFLAAERGPLRATSSTSSGDMNIPCPARRSLPGTVTKVQ